MSRRRKVCRFPVAAAVVCMVLLSGLTPARAATVFDISADFSITSNPNGVWRYGFSTTLGGALTLYDLPSIQGSGYQLWLSSIAPAVVIPSDFNNPTDGAITTCGSCTPLPAHTAAFHPGPAGAGEFSVYRFTAPSTGRYSLSATFGALDSGGTDVHILDNGISIFDHAIDQGANLSVHTSNVLALSAGDVIDFAVGFGADGNFGADSTSINASLTTAVPEPATWLLFGPALAGLGLMRRRRARRKHNGRPRTRQPGRGR